MLDDLQGNSTLPRPCWIYSVLFSCGGQVAADTARHEDVECFLGCNSRRTETLARRCTLTMRPHLVSALISTLNFQGDDNAQHLQGSEKFSVIVTRTHLFAQPETYPSHLPD